MRVARGQPIKDGGQHALPFQQNLAVGEAHDTETRFGQSGGAASVRLDAIGVEVLTTIHLDHPACFDASEVGEEWADRMLSAELPPCELSVAQGLPEGLFGVGGELAQAAGPHPGPLPQAGEGTSFGLSGFHRRSVHRQGVCA